MQLCVYELGINSSNLQQKMFTGGHDVAIKHVMPHIYKHLAPAGSLTIQILDASQVLIAESTAVTIASITAVSGNYYHGYIRFDVSAVLKKNTAYYFRLASTGYTYSGSAFVGWVNASDLRKYDDYGTTQSLGIAAPLDVEIWELKNVRKGDL